MKVLVAVASRHHATFQIGDAIASALTAAGLEVDLRRPEEVDRIDAYDAVVLGSGVYAGQWLAPAKELASRLAGELGERPVWLFSSGPIGEPPAPAGDPAGVASIIAAVGPREHRVFTGRIDPSELNLGEKVILKVVRAQPGDFRDWPAIEAWAHEIAATLEAEAAAPAGATTR